MQNQGLGMYSDKCILNVPPKLSHNLFGQLTNKYVGKKPFWVSISLAKQAKKLERNDRKKPF